MSLRSVHLYKLLSWKNLLWPWKGLGKTPYPFPHSSQRGSMNILRLYPSAADPSHLVSTTLRRGWQTFMAGRAACWQTGDSSHWLNALLEQEQHTERERERRGLKEIKTKKKTLKSLMDMPANTWFGTASKCINLICLWVRFVKHFFLWVRHESLQNLILCHRSCKRTMSGPSSSQQEWTAQSSCSSSPLLPSPAGLC